MSDTESEQFWEAHYAQRPLTDAVPAPSPAFVDLIQELSPRSGRALELGSGRGGDALWLAHDGWQVTAADASRTATERLRALAAATGVAEWVTPVAADLSVELPDGAYDLVYACYFQSPVPIDRDGIIHRAAELLTPGGLLVVIDHASVAPWSWDQDMTFPSAALTRSRFDLDPDWVPLVTEARPRIATSHDGGTEATVTDNVIVTRRP